MSRREWNTPVREPWNPLIHELLQAVDRHNRLHFATGDPWHLERAEALRAYVRELKAWIHRQEDQSESSRAHFR
jgi:hypothetical protein